MEVISTAVNFLFILVVIVNSYVVDKKIREIEREIKAIKSDQ